MDILPTFTPNLFSTSRLHSELHIFQEDALMVLKVLYYLTVPADRVSAIVEVAIDLNAITMIQLAISYLVHAPIIPQFEPLASPFSNFFQTSQE